MDENRRQKMRYRSWHRGTREMDLLMGRFADAHIGSFTPAQLDQYEVILEMSDPDLYNWITGMEPVPREHENDVMRSLVGHRLGGG